MVIAFIVAQNTTGSFWFVSLSSKPFWLMKDSTRKVSRWKPYRTNIVSIGITPAVKNKKQQKKEESDDDEPEQKKTPAVKKPVQKKGGCKANRM